MYTLTERAFLTKKTYFTECLLCDRPCAPHSRSLIYSFQCTLFLFLINRWADRRGRPLARGRMVKLEIKPRWTRFQDGLWNTTRKHLPCLYFSRSSWQPYKFSIDSCQNGCPCFYKLEGWHPEMACLPLRPRQSCCQGFGSQGQGAKVILCKRPDLLKCDVEVCLFKLKNQKPKTKTIKGHWHSVWEY